jgi:hypothetical protein
MTTFSDWRWVSTELEDIILTASFDQPAPQIPGTTVVVAMGLEVSMTTGNGSDMNLSVSEQ